MAVDPGEFFYLHALRNAVAHSNVPRAGPVLGALMSAHPEFRPQAKELSALLQAILKDIEGMSPEERRHKLEEMAPELLEKKEKKKRETGLRPLENVGPEGVVMRFAPNPSGPLHLGHARASFLNDYYVRKYGGKYVLRIEDTDPKRVNKENYQLLLDDIDWLGLDISDIVYQSDRLDIYYEYCEKLIRLGGAYVCTCDAETFREMKNARVACPCREHEPGENLRLWGEMLDGTYAEGTITVRVRTDIEHPDPAMRDYSIFRIVDSPPHPRCDARVYPLMNFSVAVDDHLLGMTHVIRGKDHIANTRRQQYIYEYFGWNMPEYFHYGRMSIEGVVLSTSAMKEGIARGTFTGWDDIHLGTLKAIARRGFKAEAVRNAMIDIGIGQTDISFSWENLFAANKALVDPMAPRYFFVPNPVSCTIEGAPDLVATPCVNPNDATAGCRHLPFTGTLYAPEDEVKNAGLIRFKDLFNVRVEYNGGTSTFTYAGNSLEEAREGRAPIIQWLPKGETVKCTLHTPGGTINGLCEPGVCNEYDQVIQFERVGFARVDEVTEHHVSAYFAHR